MIDIEGVSKSFSTKATGLVTALNTVDLSIRDNEFFTLLGPSGCGKTTLLRLIGGFEAPTTGRIRIGDIDAASLPPQKRPVNTVFQSYALFPHMTIAENVAFGLEMRKVPKAEIGLRVREALGMVRLENYASRSPRQLSGGQQQRVALARALAPRPKVLLLDEPLSALDLKLRKEMQSELKRLQRETGITFILVTHDQEEALAMSDRIAVMSAGNVLQVGEPREIYDNPESRFVADFIGESNVIPGPVLGRDPTIMIAVRPERVAVSPAVNAGQGRARGTIASITFLGLDTLYEVTLDGGSKLRSRCRDAEPSLTTGQAVVVDWPSGVERHLPN
ncbi:ABC transporter ATP-binding protein [Rhizobium sp. P38BS-XIX]|uniref:ABC transporter ATP-binding protein n=1 Tax=Rhizobium sp. P38BS-XIX TaxID=2726740 RepID=UPI001457170B|nr:ABC transporter ATP-binding protein [Rhizobium sp. P38BS-XIX]NLS01371.1 ABC transporter ATP-binding protein [Rhizobium sp. P38BS-XIX]